MRYYLSNVPGISSSLWNLAECYLRVRLRQRIETIAQEAFPSAIARVSTKAQVKVCNINSNYTFSRLKFVYVLFFKQNRGPLHQNPIVKSWCLPFPGSDRSVVMRSQRYFYEKEKKRPVQMSAYVQCPSLIAAVLMILTATVFGILASFKFGRSLLEKVIGFNK